METNGDVFPKLKLAVEFNSSADTADSQTVQTVKTIYNFRPPSKQVQNDFVNCETIRGVESILSGPQSGAFCQIMNIFDGGYGKLNIDTDLLSVRLVYEEKIKF